MVHLVRVLAILGAALSVALVHSWVHGPVIVTTRDPAQGRQLDPLDPEVDPAEGSQGAGETPATDPPATDPAPTNPPATDPPATDPPATNPPTTPRQPDRGPEQYDVTTFGKFIDFDQTRFLHRYINTGQILFIDARSKEEDYAAGHIAGAIRMSADMFDSGHPDAEAIFNYADDTRIVIYCSGGECDESESTRARLEMRGYLVSHIYKNGWEEWSQKAPARLKKTGIDP